MTPRPIFILAPGAGASSAHPRMRQFADLLGELGDVRPFDYAYVLEGRKRPDPLPRLIARHREVFDEVKREGGGPVILAGKSMGGRVGCHLALEADVAAVICFGYPLFGGGDPGKSRDAVLRELSTPVFFAQGTRDAMCPLDALNDVRSAMRAKSALHVAEGGDHSLMVSKTVLKKSSATQEQSDRAVLAAIEAFLAEVLRPPA